MYDRILQLKNEFLERTGKNPRYILFNQISYSMFLSSLENGTAFEIVHSAVFFGMKVCIVQGQVDLEHENERYYFEVL